eukprot:Gregarina_sp_Pseudo_9__1364@NODE_1913_length_1258_cov_10_136998_g1774_i0_p1_GENE_NODE_1913_length_1258_cov_10_136998_g1774_i0NODE_1913_length_1258_cov_10_136998_g1774_i0_p1_ORF_typecomplete_len251_score29_80HOOK/PF05622_12/5_5e07Myosin_tail_1/PF01576_19/5_7e07Mitofilin/PF09731_9/0_00024Filament/PF00038_21/0_00055GBP_C/PF02841_14/0_002TMCO5/PF14992_6/0_0019HMMR_N/PF15905_5/0_0033DUF3584/PF12128_8/0_0038CorA/PF01544_18/0_006DUF4407/PF14362_6/0_0069Golgin_A5/PF09787_9/0_0067ZapA/PF05164_13/0_0097Sp
MRDYSLHITAECLRKYMVSQLKNLSSEARSLMFAAIENSSLIDPWMRSELLSRFGFKAFFEMLVRPYGPGDSFSGPAGMYLEMKIRLDKFKAQTGTDVSVSDTLVTELEEWMKAKGRGTPLNTLFIFSSPPRRVCDSLVDPFVRMAAKVVAIENPKILAQETRKHFESRIMELQAEIDQFTANDRAHLEEKLHKSRAETQLIKEELEKSKIEIQEAKEECEELRRQLTSLQSSLASEIETDDRRMIRGDP